MIIYLNQKYGKILLIQNIIFIFIIKINLQEYFKNIVLKINLKLNGDISLVKATLNLFKEAFQKEDNKYFILLSDKCIPLYNANDIYNKVKK